MQVWDTERTGRWEKYMDLYARYERVVLNEDSDLQCWNALGIER